MSVLHSCMEKNCQEEVNVMARVQVRSDLTVKLREFVKENIGGVKPMQSARNVRLSLMNIDIKCVRELCKPADRSGGGESHKNKSLDIEQDGNEINVKVDILLGQNNVDANLSLNTGE